MIFIVPVFVIVAVAIGTVAAASGTSKVIKADKILEDSKAKYEKATISLDQDKHTLQVLNVNYIVQISWLRDEKNLRQK